jgi:hypothetical protein
LLCTCCFPRLARRRMPCIRPGSASSSLALSARPLTGLG